VEAQLDDKIYRKGRRVPEGQYKLVIVGSWHL